jgi:hypothetical protein
MMAPDTTSRKGLHAGERTAKDGVSGGRCETKADRSLPQHRQQPAGRIVTHLNCGLDMVMFDLLQLQSS